MASKHLGGDPLAFVAALRIQATIEAFREIAAYLAGFPGRKSIIWFSGSFPLSPTPAEAGATFGGSNCTEMILRATNMLADQQVAISPVDGKGLQSPVMFSAATRGSTNPLALGRAISNDF